MSYQSHPTLILLQFLIQTGGVVVIAILFIPILHQIIFENGYEFHIPYVESIVENLWSWSITFFIAGMAGNIIWFFRALQAYQSTQRVF